MLLPKYNHWPSEEVYNPFKFSTSSVATGGDHLHAEWSHPFSYIRDTKKLVCASLSSYSHERKTTMTTNTTNTNKNKAFLSILLEVTKTKRIRSQHVHEFPLQRDHLEKAKFFSFQYPLLCHMVVPFAEGTGNWRNAPLRKKITKNDKKIPLLSLSQVRKKWL